MIRAFLAALLIAALPALAQVAKAEGATGLWLTQKEGIIVKLYDCDGAICGQTVWLKKMNNKDGTPRLDTKNPDPALHNRHWCGINVISNVKPTAPGTWEGGEVYDPKTGETFDFNIEETAEGLKVRGYLGVPLLGKTERWTRTDGKDVEFCVG